MIGFLAILIISIVLSGLEYLLRPRIKAPKQSFQVPRVEEGAPIPVVFGTQALGGLVCGIWDIHTNDGADNSTNYYARTMLMLCHGPVDELIDVQFEKRSLVVAPDNVNIFSETLLNKINLPLPYTPAVGEDETKFFLSMPGLFGGSKREGGVFGPMDWFWGTETQPKSELLKMYQGSTKTSRYAGRCYVTFGYKDGFATGDYIAGFRFDTFLWRANTPYLPATTFILRRCPHALDDYAGGCGTIANVAGDANPAEMIWETLTNTVWGMGRAEGLFDKVRFAEVAGQLRDEGLGLSATLAETESAEDFIAEILRHIDGTFYTDQATGLVGILLARPNYAVADLIELNEDNGSEFEINRGTAEETFNETKLTFQEYTFSPKFVGITQGAVKYQDIANFQATGGARAQDVSYPMFTKAMLAQRKCDQIGRASSVPLLRLSCKTNRRMFRTVPGSVLRLNLASEGISNLAIRVGAVDYGSLQDPEITLDAIQDIFGFGAATYTPPDTSDWDGQSQDSGYGVGYGLRYGGTTSAPPEA